MQGHEGEIEKIRKELEAKREEQTDVKEQADAVTRDIEKIEEELTAVFAIKDEKRVPSRETAAIAFVIAAVAVGFDDDDDR